MKRFGLIIAASLLVLVGAGSAYVFASRLAAAPDSLKTRTAKVRSEILQDERPLVRFAPPTGDELMDPDKSLPFFQRFDWQELRRVHDLAESCDMALDTPSANFELEKARRFASYVCGHTDHLADSFFDVPPFMHPTGKSYALLAMQAGLELHRSRLHVLEKQALRNQLGELSPLEAVEAELSREDLASLWRGDTVVLSPKFAVVFAHRSTNQGLGGEYLVFPRRVWEKRLAFEGISPNFLVALSLIALAAVLVLSGTMITFAVVRLREKKKEREDHMFVVRALTHELRTPATSLGLTLEVLRSDFDHLPEPSQEAFLLLCEQVQRLNRVIAGTTRYLKTNEAKATPSHLKTLPSVNSFFESVLEPYQDRIVVDALPADRSFGIDPYLLKVCVQNLIENALRHGKPEVRVGVDVADGQLRIHVQDQGTLPETDPAKLSAAAAYGSGHGLGLGLQLVTKIVKDLGGSLSLARFPATFTLRFKEAP